MNSDKEKYAQFEAKMEAIMMERDDAISKFNENARASGDLLQKITDIEHEKEQLENELASIKEVGFHCAHPTCFYTFDVWTLWQYLWWEDFH